MTCLSLAIPFACISRDPVIAGQFPGILPHRRIIFNVLHTAATFQYEFLLSLFSQFLGRQSPADARADDNSIICITIYGPDVYMHNSLNGG